MYATQGYQYGCGVCICVGFCKVLHHSKEQRHAAAVPVVSGSCMQPCSGAADCASAAAGQSWWVCRVPRTVCCGHAVALAARDSVLALLQSAAVHSSCTVIDRNCSLQALHARVLLHRAAVNRLHILWKCLCGGPA